MTPPFGQVYLVSEGPRGPCKIGVTCDAYVRLSRLQTGNPRKLRFHGVVNHAEPYLLERALHHHFKGSHVLGEWFAITLKQAKRAMELLETKDAAALRKIVGQNALLPPPSGSVKRGGRPKVHASAADRQRACRSRKAQSHVKA